MPLLRTNNLTVKRGTQYAWINRRSCRTSQHSVGGIRDTVSGHHQTALLRATKAIGYPTGAIFLVTIDTYVGHDQFVEARSSHNELPGGPHRVNVIIDVNFPTRLFGTILYAVMQIISTVDRLQNYITKLRQMKQMHNSIASPSNI